MSEKRKTMPSSLWKIWSMQPYLGFPPSGLLKSEEREGRIQGRRVFFEFVTPPRSSRIRQLRQEKEAIDAMISSIKAEIPRLRITEQLPTSTKVPRLKAKIEEVPREFWKDGLFPYPFGFWGTSHMGSTSATLSQGFRRKKASQLNKDFRCPKI